MKHEFSLGREKMLDYLEGIQKKRPDTGSTVYIPPGLSGAQITAELAPVIAGNKRPVIVEVVQESKTGACVIADDGITVILPPFPVKQPLIFQGREISILDNALKREALIAIILIRLGAYAVGVCRGDTIFHSKVGTGLIHSRHRQGGSSAARFRRHREKQIETFLTRACGHVKENLGPYIDVAEYAVFGGARTTIELICKACPALQQLEGRQLPPLLDIPDPRQYVLEAAVKRIWSSRVIEYREEEA